MKDRTEEVVKFKLDGMRYTWCLRQAICLLLILTLQQPKGLDMIETKLVFTLCRFSFLAHLVSG